MNRRTFLSSLIALGLLPLTPAVATTVEDMIDHLDRELAREPLHFLVEKDGELALADWKAAFSRFMAYDVAPEDLDPRGARFADCLWQIEPLRCEVCDFLREQREASGEVKVGDDDYDYDEETTVRLVEASDESTVAALHQYLLGWFADDVTSEERDEDAIVRPVDGRQWAFRLFRSDVDGLSEKFDVTVVEGDHPGSTYYAAVMGMSVAEANQLAGQLGLPITFSHAD